MPEHLHPRGYLEHGHVPCGKPAHGFYCLSSTMHLWLCERHAGIMAGIWAMVHNSRDDDGRESGVKA